MAWLLFLFFFSVKANGQEVITGANDTAAGRYMNLFIEHRLENLDSALFYASMAQAQAYKEGDSIIVVRSNYALGWVYQQRGDFENAVFHYKKALSSARNNDLKDREKFILNGLGIINHQYGKYDDALSYYFESLKLREEEGDNLEIAVVCNNIGLVYYAIKDIKQAINYFNRSLKLRKDNGIGTQETLVNLGLCYSYIGEHQEAINFFQRVLDLCSEEEQCTDFLLISAYNGLGISYYTQEKDKPSQESFKKAEKLAVSDELGKERLVSLHYLSRIAFRQNNMEDALRYLEQSNEIAKKIDYRAWVSKNYKFFGEIYSSVGEFEKAYLYQNKYDSLNNLILNEEVIQNLAKIQIDYQERENLQTIDLQKSEISRRTTLLALSIIIIFLAVVILVILYRNNQQRKKVNRKLYEANEIIEKQNHELTNMNTVLEERVNERTQELNASNAALLKSNTELDNFIYKTSHDIRGPLATLQGVCNVALIDIEDKKSIDYFNKLSKTAERLNEILSKLLIINQINNSLISNELIDFEEMISEIISEQQPVTTLNCISVDKEIQGGLHFRSDQDLLRIILTNLISNAFKFYNTSGRVDSFVNIKVFNNSNTLHIQIVDNGIGIDENVSYKIFEIFSKASDMSDTAGLGLYLVKLAVEKLEGDITLSKATGGFTQFEVTLPIN